PRLTRGTRDPARLPSTTLFRSDLPRATGIGAAPEGGACLAAARRLRANGWIGEDERVVLFNTGGPLKYLDCWGWKQLSRRQLRRSEEHTSELQSRENLVCRLLL